MFGLNFVTGGILHSTFRRLYATIPESAAAARTASTPRAVRLRRVRRRPELASAKTDVTPQGLTPSEQRQYERALAKGELTQEDGTTPTAEEWLERRRIRQTRIRGVREVIAEDGTKEMQVVGQKVYLPNIIMRLVRNHTLPGQPYNPYEATFRIPPSMTKTDVRSYLSAVYGVKTTYIRTDNYLSPIYRNPINYSWTRIKPHKTYKRAVVGLVDPFYYPQALEDMSSTEREERIAYLEEELGIQRLKDSRMMALLSMTRSGSPDWRWRTGTTANRGNIMRLTAKRRAEREQNVADVKARMQESRRASDSIEQSYS